jgi:hypothetical protein
VVSRVGIVIGALLVSQGAVLAPRALAQVHSGLPAKSAKTPVPKLSISPESLLADINGNSAEDVALRYSIDGDLSHVSKAWVEIADGPHGKVVFTALVPIQASGEVVWPQGQPMDSTANSISFQVWSPDGGSSVTVEADAEYPLPGDDPTPVLSSIARRRVVIGTKNAAMILRGRNFVANALVTFSKDGVNTDAKFKSRFVNSHCLVLSLPAHIAAQKENWKVEVLENDVSNSGPRSLRIVPPGLPPAPVLNSISPSRLPSGAEPKDKWVTLHGDNFRKGDTRVMTDSIPDEFDSKFVSVHEMRALSPAAWMSGPTRADIHLESTRDADLASRILSLTILNTVGDTLPGPIRPTLDSANDGYVVMPASREAPPVTVTLRGRDFHPKSRAVATVGGDDRELKTVLVSSHELRAIVPAELWSLRFFVMTFLIDTKPATATATGKTLAAVASFRESAPSADSQPGSTGVLVLIRFLSFPPGSPMAILRYGIFGLC